jgi:hypothetical protein
MEHEDMKGIFEEGRGERGKGKGERGKGKGERGKGKEFFRCVKNVAREFFHYVKKVTAPRVRYAQCCALVLFGQRLRRER